MGKNIVICCDGTGNQYGENNTNVVKIFERIRRDMPERWRSGRDGGQIAFYDPGIGTFSAYGSVPGPLKRKTGLLLGQAFGYGLKRNLSDAMRFLMRHHEPGDDIFLFGFSRGAFTVRLFADILLRIGVLNKGCENLVPYIYEIYRNRKSYSQQTIDGFRTTFTKEPQIKLIGVFDTVASLGRGLKHSIGSLDGKLHPKVENALHAVSIDEKRKKFPVSLWKQEDGTANGQTLKQPWFAGVHSDVGGYYVDRGLSDTALLWMLSEAKACGLLLDDDWEEGISPNADGVLHKSRKGFWRIWRPAPRKIPDGAQIHESVFDRINANGKGYAPDLPEDYQRTETRLDIKGVSKKLQQAVSSTGR